MAQSVERPAWYLKGPQFDPHCRSVHAPADWNDDSTLRLATLRPPCSGQGYKERRRSSLLLLKKNICSY